MPSLKRLFFVVAVGLSMVLGMAPGAGADVRAGERGSTASGARLAVPPAAEPGEALRDAHTQPPVFTPGPPPERPEDPVPDGGVPGWLWILLALLVGAGVSVAVALWRGSRPPAGYVPVAEDTAELLAIGRQTLRRDGGGHR